MASRVFADMTQERPGWRGANRREERWTALVGVIAVHLAVGLLLLNGLATRVTRSADAPADLITLIPPPPPPELAPRSDRKEKAVAPPARKADPKPLTAPPPLVVQPVQLPAAPVAGSGTQALAGAALAGSGTGSGGLGGGGGIARHAEWLDGGIRDRDYPDAFRRAGLSGQVAVRFTVRADGRVADCRVDRSSGSDELDRLTCALVEQRLRYAPARDSAGRPVADMAGRSFTFVLGRRR